jgi:hypothetical protein
MNQSGGSRREFHCGFRRTPARGQFPDQNWLGEQYYFEPGRKCNQIRGGYEGANNEQEVCDVRGLFSGTSPLLAQTKEDKRLADSDGVLRSILGGDRGLPAPILKGVSLCRYFSECQESGSWDRASHGRGVLVCRKGTKMNESWRAPAMYSLDAGSLGVQLRSTVTDLCSQL